MDTVTTRAEALKNGQSRYYTGKPCRHGHLAKRDTVTGYCCACSLIRQNALRAQARQQLKEGSR